MQLTIRLKIWYKKEFTLWFGTFGMDLHATAELIQVRELIFSFHCHKFTQTLSNRSLRRRESGAQIALFIERVGSTEYFSQFLCIEQSTCWDEYKITNTRASC